MISKDATWSWCALDAYKAWQHQVAKAANNTELAAAMAESSAELWPRFSGYYTRLRALPRRMRRAFARKLPVSLAGAALLLALGQSEVLAATITVNGTTCTLVDAITAANDNATPAGSSCTAGNDGDAGGDLIDLQTDVTLTSVNNDKYSYYGNGLPVIASKITITGNCAGNPDNRCTINRDDNAPNFRLFSVTSDLTLDNVTLSGGTIGEFDVGGGVYNYNGTTTITNSTLSGNSAGYGGGVFNQGGTVTITDSTLLGNSAYRGGGGHNPLGTLTITNSTVSGNLAGAYGGGVYNFDTTTITNSTVSGNSANQYGGGVHNAVGATATITNSTVSGNTAGNKGGGLFNRGPTTLAGSLVSGNMASDGAEVYKETGPGTITADNHNLFGHNGLSNAQASANFTPGASDITATTNGTNPTVLTAILNTTLANNGGPTLTHALPPGSPAIDDVPLDGGGTGCVTTDPNGNPLTEDQRGVTRPQGTSCDIGSYEYQGQAPPNIIFKDSFEEN